MATFCAPGLTFATQFSTRFRVRSRAASKNSVDNPLAGHLKTNIHLDRYYRTDSNQQH